jgi:hypothetical protein
MAGAFSVLGSDEQIFGVNGQISGPGSERPRGVTNDRHSTDVGCISEETSMKKLLLIGTAVLLTATSANAGSRGRTSRTLGFTGSMARE